MSIKVRPVTVREGRWGLSLETPETWQPKRFPFDEPTARQLAGELQEVADGEPSAVVSTYVVGEGDHTSSPMPPLVVHDGTVTYVVAGNGIAGITRLWRLLHADWLSDVRLYQSWAAWHLAEYHEENR